MQPHQKTLKTHMPWNNIFLPEDPFEITDLDLAGYTERGTIPAQEEGRTEALGNGSKMKRTGEQHLFGAGEGVGCANQRTPGRQVEQGRGGQEDKVVLSWAGRVFSRRSKCKYN